MVMPSFDMSEMVSLLLSSDGKPCTPFTRPKDDSGSSLAGAVSMIKLSGGKLQDGRTTDVVELLIFQPDRLRFFPVMFFSSTYSAFGNPTTGDGSAMISSMITSNLWGR